MKKIASSLFVAGLLVSAISASAQIDALYAFQTGHTTESLVLGATAYSASTFNKVNCNWSSPTTPASLSAGGTITAGPNDGASINGFTGPRITSSLTWNMANASGRSVIRGKNNNGGTTPSALIVGMTSSRSVQVVIWGPTLSSFGLTGATNFTWTASNGVTGSSAYSNSGTGEATFTIPSYALLGIYTVNVEITPSNDNELGHVMVNFNNP